MSCTVPFYYPMPTDIASTRTYLYANGSSETQAFANTWILLPFAMIKLASTFQSLTPLETACHAHNVTRGLVIFHNEFVCLYLNFIVLVYNNSIPSNFVECLVRVTYCTTPNHCIYNPPSLCGLQVFYQATETPRELSFLSP